MLFKVHNFVLSKRGLLIFSLVNSKNKETQRGEGREMKSIKVRQNRYNNIVQIEVSFFFQQFHTKILHVYLKERYGSYNNILTFWCQTKAA